MEKYYIFFKLNKINIYIYISMFLKYFQLIVMNYYIFNIYTNINMKECF